jgi:hypothetical protein
MRDVIPKLIRLLAHEDSGVVSSVALLLGELAGHGERQSYAI